MSKMASVNILDYKISCSQGDLNETVDAILNGSTKISSKNINLNTQETTIPFFSFKDEVAQNQKSIYAAIKIFFQKLSSILTSKKENQRHLLLALHL